MNIRFFTFLGHVHSGVKFDDYDKIPVEMSGRDAKNIHLIDRFKEAELNSKIVDNIERLKYSRPTPIQKNALPVILAGRDLMACAQTGSGKTAAFLVPTIELMIREGPPVKPDMPPQPGMPGNMMFMRRNMAYPVALILAPTRELACQIHDEAKRFTYLTGEFDSPFFILQVFVPLSFMEVLMFALSCASLNAAAIF